MMRPTASKLILTGIAAIALALCPERYVCPARWRARRWRGGGSHGSGGGEAFTAVALLREDRVPTAVGGIAAGLFARPATRVFVPVQERGMLVSLIALGPVIPLRESLALCHGSAQAARDGS